MPTILSVGIKDLMKFFVIFSPLFDDIMKSSQIINRIFLYKFFSSKLDKITIILY